MLPCKNASPLLPTTASWGLPKSTSEDLGILWSNLGCSLGSPLREEGSCTLSCAGGCDFHLYKINVGIPGMSKWLFPNNFASYKSKLGNENIRNKCRYVSPYLFIAVIFNQCAAAPWYAAYSLQVCHGSGGCHFLAGEGCEPLTGCAVKCQKKWWMHLQF